MPLDLSAIASKDLKSMKAEIKEAASRVLDKEDIKELHKFVGQLDKMGSLFSSGAKDLDTIIAGVVGYINKRSPYVGLTILVFLQAYDLAKTAKDEAALSRVGKLLATSDFAASGDFADLVSAVNEARDASKNNELYQEHKRAWSSVRNQAAYRLAVLVPAAAAASAE